MDLAIEKADMRSFLLLRLRNQFVIIFFRQKKSSAHNASSIDEQNGPTDGAQHPRLVELPSDEEAIVVVVEVCLL